MTELELLQKLNTTIAKTDLSKVTADSAGFKDLPDGYYNCELMEAKLKETKTGKPMISGMFKVFEDGLKESYDPNTGTSELVLSTGSKGRYIWVNWVIGDESAYERFVSDMKKFEDDDGNPILPEEAYTDGTILLDSLEAIKGMHVYIMLQTLEKNGEKSQRSNLISWTRAKELELPL